MSHNSLEFKTNSVRQCIEDYFNLLADEFFGTKTELLLLKDATDQNSVDESAEGKDNTSKLDRIVEGTQESFNKFEDELKSLVTINSSVFHREISDASLYFNRLSCLEESISLIIKLLADIKARKDQLISTTCLPFSNKVVNGKLNYPLSNLQMQQLSSTSKEQFEITLKSFKSKSKQENFISLKLANNPEKCTKNTNPIDEGEKTSLLGTLPDIMTPVSNTPLNSNTSRKKLIIAKNTNISSINDSLKKLNLTKNSLISESIKAKEIAQINTIKSVNDHDQVVKSNTLKSSAERMKLKILNINRLDKEGNFGNIIVPQVSPLKEKASTFEFFNCSPVASNKDEQVKDKQTANPSIENENETNQSFRNDISNLVNESSSVNSLSLKVSKTKSILSMMSTQRSIKISKSKFFNPQLNEPEDSLNKSPEIEQQNNTLPNQRDHNSKEYEKSPNSEYNLKKDRSIKFGKEQLIHLDKSKWLTLNKQSCSQLSENSFRANYQVVSKTSKATNLNFNLVTDQNSVTMPTTSQTLPKLKDSISQSKSILESKCNNYKLNIALFDANLSNASMKGDNIKCSSLINKNAVSIFKDSGSFNIANSNSKLKFKANQELDSKTSSSYNLPESGEIMKRKKNALNIKSTTSQDASPSKESKHDWASDLDTCKKEETRVINDSLSQEAEEFKDIVFSIRRRNQAISPSNSKQVFRSHSIVLKEAPINEHLQSTLNCIRNAQTERQENDSPKISQNSERRRLSNKYFSKKNTNNLFEVKFRILKDDMAKSRADVKTKVRLPLPTTCKNFSDHSSSIEDYLDKPL